jgi:hypothetical protein
MWAIDSPAKAASRFLIVTEAGSWKGVLIVDLLGLSNDGMKSRDPRAI